MIERELREAVKKGATKLKRNKTKLLKPEKPVRMAATFQKTILPMLQNYWPEPKESTDSESNTLRTAWLKHTKRSSFWFSPQQELPQ
jgi:D-aminopeptidase